MDNSHLQVTPNGRVSAYVGPDATALFHARILASSLKLYHSTGGRIIPTRGMTGPKMLKLATNITGKAYKRGEYEKAAADVKTWADTMLAALPIEIV